jgi:gamma-glutamyltranspeptidase/glutathione hydrolase
VYLGTRCAIASESYLATRTGYEVYKMGTTPWTPSRRSSSCLSMSCPHLGGDFLALVHRGGRVEAVVGFGWALKRVPKRPPRRGLQSAVVPGYVAGLYELHRRHGSLPWERVVDTTPEAMEKPLCTPRRPLP